MIEPPPPPDFLARSVDYQAAKHIPRLLLLRCERMAEAGGSRR
jgi:hypothetical protein